MRREVFPLRIRLPQGFTLEEGDVDFVHLCYRGERIASFAARGVDPVAIRATAEAYAASVAVDDAIPQQRF